MASGRLLLTECCPPPLPSSRASPEFDQLVQQIGSSLCVVDFYATWCGPCQAIAPSVKALSDRLLHATFCKASPGAFLEPDTSFRTADSSFALGY